MRSQKSGCFAPKIVPSAVIHEVDGETYYDSVTLHFKTGELQVFVGDTVVIPCKNAKKECTATWFPWKDDEPWSAVQVLSLYKTFDSKYKMAFRWFWRYSEVYPSHKKLLKDVPKVKAVRLRSIIESSSTDISFVDQIIGQAVVTSEEDGFQQFSKETTVSSHQPVPVVALLCKGYFDFLAQPEAFKVTTQWKGDSRSNSHRDIMLSRGFICLAKSERKTLMNRFIEVFESRNEMPCSKLRRIDTQNAKRKRSVSASSKVKVAKATSEEIHNRKRRSRNVESGSACLKGNDCLDEETSIKDFGRPTVNELEILRKGTDCYSGVTVPVHLDKCASRFVSKAHHETWRVAIGDIVCIHREGTAIPGSKNKGPGQWHPFKVPWACCQVLTIYKKGSEVNLEVRWFPRASTLDEGIQSSLHCNFADDELLETVAVDSDIPATTVLGRVDLLLGHHPESVILKDKSSTIPTIRRRCRYFFYESLRRIQPIFCGDPLPRMWHQRLLARGLKASPLLQQKELTYCCEQLLLTGEEAWSSFADLQSGELNVANDETSVIWSDGVEDLLLIAHLKPPWHHYVDADNVCHVDDREAQVWVVRVGDIVAALHEDSKFHRVFADTDHRYFPFKVNWCPCQVASMSRIGGVLRLEVRWLLGSSDLSGNTPLPQDSFFDLVYESTSSSTSFLSCDSLLGPLWVASQVPVSIPPFLPHCVLVYGGLWSCEEQVMVCDHFTMASMVERSIKACRTYDTRVDKVLLQKQVLNLHMSKQGDESHPFALADQFNDVPSLTESTSGFADGEGSNGDDSSFAEASPSRKVASHPLGSIDRVSTSVYPFHLDKSARRAYYTEMDIIPPYCTYACHDDNHGKELGPWKVKVGDIVVVRYKHGAGKAFFDVNKERNHVNHPFVTGWAVAEIVLIWRTYDAETDLPLVGSDMESPKCHQSGDLDLEIRWLWRRRELPGLSKPGAPSLCEEVFETDHIDRCTAESVLAPAKVHFSTDAYVRTALYELGMPVVQFRCSRFWSFHRKSVVPFAKSTGRLARSRMYSACFSQDHVLKDALERFEARQEDVLRITDCGAACDDENYDPTWKDAFRMVIQKLSVSQASTDAFEKGATLLERDRERNEITSFLRGAIQSAMKSETSGSKSPSLFIAGPPGTGKTVSVCSIIEKLRHEQIDGDLPYFDFFSLNGMEMRHPFDTYVKFWEMLSGTARERLAPGMAAAKLERYFSGHSVKNAPKRPVVVLLLDEVDYLVTKKETVLYNFFDWPKRSFETPDCPRLIVIGISNTVDLPTKLKASVRSRLGSARCDFKAYNVRDIVSILENKIQPDPSMYVVFEKDAILFAAKKVAAMSGDIRTALQTCKAAAEAVMVEAERRSSNDPFSDPQSISDWPVVRIKDVQRVTREKMGSVVSQALAGLAPLEALVVVAVTSLSKSSGRGAGGLDILEVSAKVESVANAFGNRLYLPPPSFTELLSILERLADSRLICLRTEKSSVISFRSSRGGSGGAWPMIASVVASSDVLPAFRQGQHRQLAESQLGGYDF
jgi:origin recognition complex subunit 1